jgi:hypothetical protein
MKLPVALNRNTVLIFLGILAVSGPDIQAAANWLTASGIPHVTGIVHILGILVLACGGLALALPWLRQTMAKAGLATPPGAVAPWNPAKDNVVPMVQAPRSADPDSVNTPAKQQAVPLQDDKTPITVPFKKGPTT